MKTCYIDIVNIRMTIELLLIQSAIMGSNGQPESDYYFAKNIINNIMIQILS